MISSTFSLQNQLSFVRLQLILLLLRFPPQQLTFSSSTTVFDGFRRLNSELRSTMTSDNLKSCELDTLPSFIIIEMLDDFSPFSFIYETGSFLKATLRLHKREP